MYKYEYPLCTYFEVLKAEPENYFDSVHRCLVKQLIDIQSLKIENNHVVIDKNDLKYLFDEFCITKIDKSLGDQRIDLYQSSPYKFIIEYYGITAIQEDFYIISAEKIQVGIEQILDQLDSSGLFSLMNKILNMINLICYKNSYIGALGPKNFGFCGNELKM